ncbi:MAG: hypothetical protein A2817_03510 [Candidatus Yanofskybacteria bacterium RIFCSPHIGHO2_01_FULL_39_8b]|uniref:BioF2-like acetyltransferase domain-containing protein n=1 Tax=Candidatus Yanofskybacteria bacterium RIFCSPHIGHO2_01_FULL_39_8b TaxID=1802659 RepID=A0A1F8EH81_9BACT|nr:MAG: hypothetical protein A2817_03510 [Candidatus Yanofskybacteria bacterium RIFCSPHIGHO2_01_FULL_39_8b]
MKSFLQTEEWLKFQKEVGHKTWRFDDGKIWANIIKYPLPFGKSYLYIPHGPEIEFDRIKSGLKNELANFIKYLKDLAGEEKSIFVKMEPLLDVVAELIYRKGIKKSSKQIQPQRTVIVDLGLSEEHLLGRMHQKTRYNINLSEKKGLQLEESADVDMFWELLKQTAKKDQFFTHPKEYYKKMLEFFKDGKELQTKLFLVKANDDRAVGAAIVMIYYNSAYYLHGAMDREYKSLMVPYFMHWEIIKFLKLTTNNLRPITFYDFWGIDAKKWPGVTRFKLGWGGREKEYPGSFDIPISRFWYFAYNLARKII